ncbi:MAG TPA: hypothetical protein VHA75_13395, partial [Rugosimonospora sp.]|nr:hypothetical protein [Rugosimonospora sp.]
PGLGLYGSLASAREQVRAERRNAAIAASLRKMLTEGKDPLPAEIAVNVFDTDQIARVIAAGADYDGLARLIAATLVPRRVLPGQPSAPRGKPSEGTGAVPATEPPAADEATTAPPQAPTSRPARGNRAGNRGRRAVRNHGAAAINNARQLRLIYPHGITVSERQVRMRTGWQYKRTNAALAAYYDRADLTDQEREPDRDGNHDAGSLREGTG